MLPLSELRDKTSFGVELGPFDPPPLVGAGELLASRKAITFWRVVFVGSLALLVYLLWPAEIVRGEISYIGLQQETMSGNVEFISIDGATATGTFRDDRGSRGGEIQVMGQAAPGEPGDETARVNAFAATIPADTLDSFVAMAERSGTEVRIIPET